MGLEAFRKRIAEMACGRRHAAGVEYFMPEGTENWTAWISAVGYMRGYSAEECIDEMCVALGIPRDSEVAA